MDLHESAQEVLAVADPNCSPLDGYSGDVGEETGITCALLAVERLRRCSFLNGYRKGVGVDDGFRTRDLRIHNPAL